MAPAPPPSRTAIEGRFQLGQRLDGWGFGEAWRARDGNFRNRAVVVKFLDGAAVDGGALSSTLLSAIKSARTLRHPQLLALVHSGLHEGRAYLAYEGFEGNPLVQRLDEAARTGTALDLDTVERIADLACVGLGAAHEAAQPVVHGAVHPSAFALRTTDAGMELKALDLGLGPFIDSVTLEARRAWTAPERLRGGLPPDPVPAHDVFPLGLLVVEMLLAHLDATRRDNARAVAVREGASRALRLREDVPEAVWEVLDQALRHDPGTRFEHASALRDALHSAWRTRSSYVPREAGGRSSVAGPPDLSQLSGRRLSHVPDDPPAPAFAPAPPPPGSWGSGWDAGPAPPAPSPYAAAPSPYGAAPAPYAAAPLPLPAAMSPGPPPPSPWGPSASPLALPPLPTAAPAPVALPLPAADPWRPSASDWSQPVATDNPWDVPHHGMHAHSGGFEPIPPEAPREQTRALDLDALEAAGLGPSSFHPHAAPREETRALDLDALQAEGALRANAELRATAKFAPSYAPPESTADTALPDEDDYTPPDGIALPDDHDEGPQATLTPGQFRPSDQDEDWRDAVMMLDTAAMARALPSAPMNATTRPPTRSPGEASPHGEYDDDGSTSVQSRSALGAAPAAFAPAAARPPPSAPRRPMTMQAPTVPRRAPETEASETLRPMQRSSVLPETTITPSRPGSGAPTLPPGQVRMALPPNDLFAQSPQHPAERPLSPRAQQASQDPFALPGATPTGTMPLPRASLPMGFDVYHPPTAPGPGMPGYVPPPAAMRAVPAPKPNRGRVALLGVVLLLALVGLAFTFR